ncbi:MAG TPA: hypothetical protein VMS40_18495 [Vicinamibacterales bacterium]|nr:hypothetical protein [Vicinamibacterales bacterium]
MNQDDRFRGPWFDAKTAALYIPCKSVHAFYDWRKYHGIIARANGSVAKADLDKVLKRPQHANGGSRRNPASLANLDKGRNRKSREAVQSLSLLAVGLE